MKYPKVLSGRFNDTIVKSFFTKGHERTLVVRKNVVVSFIIKGGAIAITLIVVPLTIDYVNPTQYGIWVTLTSIVAWFGFLDIGFGSGLKNKLSEAIAAGEDELARIYVSTTYGIMALISLGLLAIILITNIFLDWSKILNSPPSMASELSTVAMVVFFVFCVQFVLQLLNTVCAANQRTALISLFSFLGHLLSLVIIFILLKTTEGSLLYLCLSIGLSPLLVLFISTVVLYRTSYKKYAPSLRLVDFSYVKRIMHIGIQFFLIQIGMIFFYSSHNLIISHIIGPTAVTSYNIAFKYFGVITLLSSIVMAPLWTAFTEANIQKDYQWIKKTVRDLEKICLLIFIISIGMLVGSPFFYRVWVGDSIIIPISLSAVLALYTAINTYRTIFCFYLNGVGKIRLQLYIVIVSGLINIPFGIWMGHLFGITGIILATTILCVFCGIIEVSQYKKLIENRADGIWNK